MILIIRRVLSIRSANWSGRSVGAGIQYIHTVLSLLLLLPSCIDHHHTTMTVLKDSTH